MSPDRRLQSIDQANQISKTRTDAGGRTLESYDTLNKKSWAEYDPAGNVKKSRDPNNVGFDAVYDLLGRATSQTDTVGDVTSTSYDKAGNVKTQTDAKNKVTTTIYDVLGRTKSVIDRLTNATAYAYDLAGRMTSITDAQGKATTYAYNVLGAKTEETYPDHTGGNSGDATYGKVKFTYDPAGRMIRREDQKGDTVAFNHTMAGTITSRNYRTKANSPSGTIADSDTFTFDNLGRMLTAVSGRYTNTVTMNYDSYGRLKDESLTLASQTYTVTRAYDARSRLTQLTYPNGSVVQRTYTTRSQLHTVKYLGTTVDTRTYDDGGRLGTSTYANGAVVSFAYRNDNLPTSIATTHAGSPNIGTYSYTWDANKNKTGETITSTMSGFGFSTGATGYDDEDRLQTWNRTNGTMNQAWTLSAVGNWNNFTSAGSTWNRTHSNAHEFTGFTGASTGTLAYDVKGNQTSRPATLSAPALNLDWNFDNQLRGADTNGSAGSLEVTFEYDALGRRVSRSHSSGNVVYVHAGQQVIADYARGTAAASPSYRYVYADYVDEPILRHTGTGTTLPTTGDNALYYHRNQQYSIIGLTNAAGTLVERYSYTAYGTLGIYDASGTVRTSSTYANRYTYTGREYDPDLNLYHFRARWYDPSTGGFISRDPLGYVDGMSLYRGYFGVNGVDPSGKILPAVGAVCGLGLMSYAMICIGFEFWNYYIKNVRDPNETQSACFAEAFSLMPSGACNIRRSGSYRWFVSDNGPVTVCGPPCLLEFFGGAFVILPPWSLDCKSCEGILQLIMTLTHECTHIPQDCSEWNVPCNEFWAYSTSMLAMYNSRHETCRKLVDRGYCASIEKCEKSLLELIDSEFIEYDYYQRECWAKDAADRRRYR